MRTKWIRFGLVCLGLMLLGVSAALLVPGLSQYAAAGQEYQALAASFAPPAASAAPGTDIPARSINWAGLTAESPDAVAWLCVPALEGCDYPVMHRSDNDFYLHHSAAGVENSSGALFLDAACAADGSDLYRIVYGHNMKNGTMFGGLKRYVKEDFYRENGGTFFLYTPLGAARYEIFSVEYAAAGDAACYTVGYPAGAEYLSYLQAMQAHSLYPIDAALSADSRVLTLSTCSYNEETRLVVHAVQTEYYAS